MLFPPILDDRTASLGELLAISPKGYLDYGYKSIQSFLPSIYIYNGNKE